VLAPTDLNGQNPRPDLRPHVVNNSWGDQSGGDPWYRQTVRAWIAAGIFPAFAAGNNAFPPFLVCRTTGSPGDYRESFASGATDRNDAIAAFSSRGPSDFGAIKPDVVAPGVDVRSSVRNNGYAAFDGTSMASPHSAATVALLWSALPALTGDVPSTQYLLKTSALGRPDARCGDAGPPNNVYGWGRLDARAAIQAGQTVGRLTGVVTGRGVPLKTAIVVISDPLATFTASDGSYSAYPRPGTYQVTVRKSGYASQTKTATITTGQTTRLDFDLE
jgi:subtilisin family serine protease